jgi:DNA polymerase
MRDKTIDALKWYSLMDVDYFFKQEQLKHHEVTDEILVEEGSYVNNDVTFQLKDAEQDEYSASSNSLDYKISQARKIADNVQTLEELKQELINFDLCDLKYGAKNLVFADGSANSEIMLIGEAPGATEDEMGIPFCGISGNLLDNMLATIGMKREKNFYITNTVFWRPPDNRQPTSEEVAICRPFLEKHIAIINPKIIVLVGGVAVSSLLGPQMQISKIRGQLYEYSNPYIKNISTTAVFHPAYLIRQPLKKKTAWFDLLHLKKILQQINVSY